MEYGPKVTAALNAMAGEWNSRLPQAHMSMFRRISDDFVEWWAEFPYPVDGQTTKIFADPAECALAVSEFNRLAAEEGK